jgi:predicted amidophosphoribosyltransferase
MIEISTEHIIGLANGAQLAGDYLQARQLLLKLATPPRDLLSEVTYQFAKEMSAAGNYQSARDLFIEVAETHSSKAVRSLAQERNSLINRILKCEQPCAPDHRQVLAQIKAHQAERMRFDMLRPEVEFAACAAAYRSGWDPQASDALSALIRLMKKGVEEETIQRLGALLAAYIHAATPVLRWADFVVPVPTQPERLTQRGYSIPGILAEEVSKMCAVPLHDELVRPTGGVIELRTVPKWYRRDAIKGAFDVGKKATWIVGREALIIDDVMTTGATTRELARVLHSHGAHRVFAVALAHTEWSGQ